MTCYVDSGTVCTFFIPVRSVVCAADGIPYSLAWAFVSSSRVILVQSSGLKDFAISAS